MESIMRPRAFLDRRRLAAGGDGGFSLVEAVIALMIAAGVFSSVSVALLQTVRSSVQARQVQLATDLMNQQVEYVRSLDYAKATEIKADLAGDPDLTYNSGTNT
ncbi:MAG: type IV pilus modification PilV family protein [Gemmatimonadaceae bacterium]